MDKQGACSVLSAFRAAVDLDLKVNVTATLGMTFNLIGEESYLPSEIIKSMDGKYVEIANTDAEGRLVLADCLTYI